MLDFRSLMQYFTLSNYNITLSFFTVNCFLASSSEMPIFYSYFTISFRRRFMILFSSREI